MKDSRGHDDPHDHVNLERRFDAAMVEIYERAGSEVAYWATRYLQLLRRRGGLGTARYLLAARVTSDGYARLRDAGRLDLTVEALVLRPEFEPLFSAEELERARERLAQYRAMPTAEELEPSPELLALVDEAYAAPAARRIEFRDRIAAFGPSAIVAMRRSVDDGRSPGLAIGVIEVVGRTADPSRSLSALRGLRAKLPDWKNVTAQAIARIEAEHRRG